MTIKLNNHITAGQINNWLSKGVEIEQHGFKLYAVTDTPWLIKMIQEANNA